MIEPCYTPSMQNDNSLLSIKRIKEFQKNKIEGFNNLLDKGTVWDDQQGIRFLANKDNVLFIAYWDGVPAGFLTAYRLQRFDNRKAEVLLYEIGVSESFRRKGIAKTLIEEVKKWAIEVEADEVWVLTNKSNEAGMALYASGGGVTENDDEQMFVYKI
jgi:ribosomal protein S18 acetylase RimI-like enzyme